MNYPVIVEIIETKSEAKDIKTFRFRYNKKVSPGQFFMVWIPGIDEIPMSASYTDNLKGVTVERIGEATSALHNLKAGDKIGIRGPYGNGFSTPKGKTLFVAGGTGIIPIASLVEKIKRGVVVFGAKTKDNLIFLDRIRQKASKPYISTDDGSFGWHGFASDLAKKVLGKEKFSQIITCGPEKMMKKILSLGLEYKIPVQASLERYMKCGIGICDSCAINGYHVCKDGPVFDDKILRKMKDFGRFKRDCCGRRAKI
ncbi:MAG: dihydroorotate dehydrogenase electron transfer subunit [Euryarchaeota archaeon CG_4_9_14_3_um_filter_38_12]|nr:MAG: dihydroorotate dehydrogenase electron transfer subunit [Euryarchaeota archaeon CG_4_9_14_3_um_filter_38_12]